MAEAKARRKIKLAVLGISSVRPRRAVTGALILEVPGQNSAPRADRLAVELRSALEGTGVKVEWPVKLAELQVAGLDESVTRAELIEALATVGGCPKDEIKAGEIRRSSSGLGTIWAQYPMSAAKKVVDKGRVLWGGWPRRSRRWPPAPSNAIGASRRGTRSSDVVDRGSGSERPVL